MFYIGACTGSGLPLLETFSAIKAHRPLINLCFDGGDPPWHRLLHKYAEAQCFTRQVSIDGHRHAPVDVVTLAPIDTRYFSGDSIARDIRCGWAGNLVGTHRRQLVDPLRDVLTVREPASDYADFAHFLRRCHLVLNCPITGSTRTMHVKAQVLEAGFAGAALLERHGSPTAKWIPPDCYFQYDDAVEARHLITSLSDNDIRATAGRLHDFVLAHYQPKTIYSDMLRGLV